MHMRVFETITLDENKKKILVSRFILRHNTGHGMKSTHKICKTQTNAQAKKDTGHEPLTSFNWSSTEKYA